MGRIRLVRGQDGMDKGCPKSRRTYSGTETITRGNGIFSRNAIFSGFLSFLAPQINFTKPLGVCFTRNRMRPLSPHKKRNKIEKLHFFKSHFLELWLPFHSMSVLTSGNPFPSHDFSVLSGRYISHVPTWVSICCPDQGRILLGVLIHGRVAKVLGLHS